MERLRFQPWGLLGGSCGAHGRIEVKRSGNNDFEQIHKADAIRASVGDVIRLSTAGGGGYGNPAERAVTSVLEDVRNGFVTVAGAERDYAVVIRHGRVDEQATAALRDAHHGAAPDTFYTLGAAREQYEQVWTDAVSEVLAGILYSLPQAMRYEVRGRLWRAMEQRRAEGQPCTPAALEALWAEQRLRMQKSALRIASGPASAAA
jgi:N-methylhydantoinase B